MDGLTARRGFTLVELSIVLVVIGLLVGGVIVGKNMYRAAQMRAVTAEYTRYITAIRSFHDEYGALPGDMANATSIWGDDNTNCADPLIANGSPGTCNGNGDNMIDLASAAGATGEIFQFWKQLQLAKYISDQYTGIAGSGGTQHCLATPGNVNCPKSRMPNAGWWTRGYNSTTGNATVFSLYYGNYLETGALRTNSSYYGAYYTPDDVRSVDTKLDDGKPGTGFIVPRYRDACTDSSSDTDYKASYLDDSTTLACTIVFVNQF